MDNKTTLNEILLKNVKKGEFFLLTDKVKYNEDGDVLENYVYVRGEYFRQEKKFEAYKYSDVNYCMLISPNRKVFVGFTF